MMQAEIHHVSGNHFGALQVVLKCISMAEQYNASLLRALSLALLADVELAMDINKHAFSAIADALPTLLAHGSIESRGYARQVYGKCQFAVAVATKGDGETDEASYILFPSRNSFFIVRLFILNDLRNVRRLRDDISRLSSPTYI